MMAYEVLIIIGVSCLFGCIAVLCGSTVVGGIIVGSVVCIIGSLFAAATS